MQLLEAEVMELLVADTNPRPRHCSRSARQQHLLVVVVCSRGMSRRWTMSGRSSDAVALPRPPLRGSGLAPLPTTAGHHC